MIRTFRHKGIEAFFRAGTNAGIQAKHAARLRLQLSQLDHASGPNGMNAPPWKLHEVKGPSEQVARRAGLVQRVPGAS